MRDHVTAEDEAFDGDPLLVPVVRGESSPRRCRAWTRSGRGAANNSPRCLRRLLPGRRAAESYPLTYSDRVEAEAARLGVKSGDVSAGCRAT